MSKVHASIRRGFTLIEVLVATAIMVVIVLAVVTIASDTFKAYDRAVSDLSSQSEARSVLDAMENDFQTAVIRPDGRCWMEVVMPDTPSIPGPKPQAVGNLSPSDHPIVMLFASPVDRPRWSPQSTAGARVPLRGDVCAVAYRIGQRSPFDMPGELSQQIYGVYRTVIDPESTFNQALPIIMRMPPPPEPQVPGSPWSYWTGTARRVPNYSANDVAGAFEDRILIDEKANFKKGDTAQPCWTLHDNNFVGSNVVAMNLIFWCSSSLPPVSNVVGALTDPLKRPQQMLRPVIISGYLPDDAVNMKFGAASTQGGYNGAFRTAPSNPAAVASAPLRFAPLGLPTGLPAAPPAVGVHPYDHFGSRLRIFSDRMYPDGFGPESPAVTGKLNYLPYSLRGVEVSITVLTPEGSKELRGMQALRQNAKLPPGDLNEFRRIVYQHGRTFTRYIRLLGNGG